MRTTLFALLTLAATPAIGQTCGGPVDSFRQGALEEAIGMGLDPTATRDFLMTANIDPAVLNADRSQGVFQLDFVSFSQRLISANRLQNARSFSDRYDAVFDRIETTYGVPRGILLAFWAFETDFGQVQGTFNTRDALFTLAHDCRRPDLFRPELFAAIELYARGDFPLDTTGAWAGEIGQVQMLPRDIIDNGVDGDGDGQVTLKTSAEDALLSGANLLVDLGWTPDQPVLQEISVPASLDWTQTGLDKQKTVAEWQALGVNIRNGAAPDPGLAASVLLPMGRGGPAFFAYPNFPVLFEWNQSLTYVLTTAYFATRIEGAPVYDTGNPETGLSGEQMVQLQERLQALGYDVGGADGILGEKTREAVQQEQARRGLPADAWPTAVLLEAL
ncbi:peptidoglycan-binding protein [Loktanella sp. SALINAS62]|uniref:lytic murein transglycosylase n=1 Tax=Loktanella sp. SALINAS62 TaxID=2706124 RepID=UPI001B8D703E|nr:peptidoglycan-binding protein [Loktanella sp. SALINAS62]MBS1300923.1 lytic murein transglycosylase [Loktanella sp. SALINAS62]